VDAAADRGRRGRRGLATVPVSPDIDWELDHVFIATVAGDLSVRALEGAGLVFRARGNHPGQGTANACTRFENAFLEVLYATNLADIRSDIVRPLGLDERTRWRSTGACPFGLCFRPTSGTTARALPFPTWPYAAPYLPPSTNIPIVTPPGSLLEPLVFLSADPTPAWRKAGADVGRRIAAVHVRLPDVSALSAGVKWFAANPYFTIEQGPRYEMELDFEPRSAAAVRRLDPDVPLALRW
jgi:hypothetical protein